ncbi:MAG: cysteine desulfurase [Methylocystis sp.]|nr:cysteine desulfurase [Methylocystis sp.]MCA3590485.1 cysteine desulfurase [Methylocystis sp.]
MKPPVFLDGFSTQPLAPEARAAMLDAWETPGNAGSPNGAGDRAALLLASGRKAVADLIGAAPSEITFTSGATEANNLALAGVARALRACGSTRSRLIVSAIEHKSVLETAAALAGEGFEVVHAPVDAAGRLDLNAFADLADERLLLASVMLVNNETGAIQPVAEAAALTHRAGGFFHTDAAQAVGKIPVNVVELDVDYLSLSAHKCYGPMGVGALFRASSAPAPRPLLFGGRQESGIRPGTEPVALVAGFGAAATLALLELEDGARAVDDLLSTFLNRLAVRQLRHSRVANGHPTVPGGAAIRIPGVDGDALCAALAKTVAISTGSACTSGQLTTSHVLAAMGYSVEAAKQVVRVSFNRYLDRDCVILAADEFIAAAERCRLATGGVLQ